jgi:hypothetical protein
MWAAIEKERQRLEASETPLNSANAAFDPSPSSHVTSAAAVTGSRGGTRRFSKARPYTPTTEDKVIQARPYRPSTAERNADIRKETAKVADTTSSVKLSGVTCKRAELREKLSNPVITDAPSPVPPRPSLPNFVKDAASLIALNLRGRNFASHGDSDSSAKELARMLLSTKFPELKSINLRSCNLGAAGMETLSAALCTEGSNFPSLVDGDFDLRANFLEDGVAFAILLCEHLRLVSICGVLFIAQHLF